MQWLQRGRDKKETPGDCCKTRPALYGLTARFQVQYKTKNMKTKNKTLRILQLLIPVYGIIYFMNLVQKDYAVKPGAISLVFLYNLIALSALIIVILDLI